MGLFDFFKRQTTESTRGLPQVYSRDEVMKEHRHECREDEGRAQSPALLGRRRVISGHDERTREVIDESAMNTRRRATAESRLHVAEDMLDDLALRGKENADDRISRRALARLRNGLDRRFPVRASKARSSERPTAGVNKAQSRVLLERFELCKDAASTHPYVRWVTVTDPCTEPACRALNGRTWEVLSSALHEAVYVHIRSNIKDCRCRLSPLSQPRLARETLALVTESRSGPTLMRN